LRAAVIALPPESTEEGNSKDPIRLF
jgi:hypothetical protein